MNSFRCIFKSAVVACTYFVLTAPIRGIQVQASNDFILADIISEPEPPSEPQPPTEPEPSQCIINPKDNLIEPNGSSKQVRFEEKQLVHQSPYKAIEKKTFSNLTWQPSMAISEKAETLVGVTPENLIKVWNFSTKDEIVTFNRRNEHTDRILSVALSPDGSIVASGSEDDTIKLWNIKSNTHGTLPGHNGDVSSLSFYEDFLASAGGDGKVKIWDWKSGSLICTLNADNTWVQSVTFSPNGEILATSGSDKNIRLWSMEDLKKEFQNTISEVKVDTLPIEPAYQGALDLTFSPNSKILAAALYTLEGEDKFGGQVRLWNYETKRTIHNFTGLKDAVQSVAFSPDNEGKYLLAGSNDGSIRLWDWKNEKQLTKQLTSFSERPPRIGAVTFKPTADRQSTNVDDLVAISASDTGNIVSWQFKPSITVGRNWTKIIFGILLIGYSVTAIIIFGILLKRLKKLIKNSAKKVEKCGEIVCDIANSLETGIPQEATYFYSCTPNILYFQYNIENVVKKLKEASNCIFELRDTIHSTGETNLCEESSLVPCNTNDVANEDRNLKDKEDFETFNQDKNPTSQQTVQETSDLVQETNNFSSKFQQQVPKTDDFIKIVKPVFWLTIALHIILFSLGVWLFCLGLSKSPINTSTNQAAESEITNSYLSKNTNSSEKDDK